MDDLMNGTSGCLQPGMEVGSFTVMEFLGAGAVGESYLAVGPSGTEDTVVHLLSPQRNATAELMQRLDDLMERARGIRNLHVLEMLDAQTDEFFNWAAFRRSDWKTLATLIAERKKQGETKFSDKEVRRIIFQVLLALCVLHNRGILHGSLKPEHCFVDEEFRIEVGDSGLYPLLGFPGHFGPPGEGVVTVDIPDFAPRMDAVIQSTIFSAPECCRAPNFSVESDLYSVGFLAWHLFTGNSRAGANFFYELPEEIQSEWGEWFFKATEPLPSNRFRTAEEMISELPGVEIVEDGEK